MSFQLQVNINNIILRGQRLCLTKHFNIVSESLNPRREILARANVAKENETKEKENLFSLQLMENSEKLELAGTKINMLQKLKKDLEHAKERVSQLQNQLTLEQEKTTKLEMQIRAESALESVGDPVEQSIQSTAGD